MNVMSKSIRVLSLVWVLIATIHSIVAQAADATSFNPVPISIKAKSAGGVPIGAIVAWPIASNPEDWDKWLECNGQIIDAGVYPELAALVGARTPDLRGLFLRGHGSQTHSQENGSTIGVTATLHQSGALGQVQGDAIRNMTGDQLHGWGNSSGSAGLGGIHGNGVFTGLYPASRPYPSIFESTFSYSSMGVRFDAAGVVPTAPEIRPANMAVRYLIRAIK